MEKMILLPKKSQRDKGFKKKRIKEKKQELHYHYCFYLQEQQTSFDDNADNDSD